MQFVFLFCFVFLLFVQGINKIQREKMLGKLEKPERLCFGINVATNSTTGKCGHRDNNAFKLSLRMINIQMLVRTKTIFKFQSGKSRQLESCGQLHDQM